MRRYRSGLASIGLVVCACAKDPSSAEWPTQPVRLFVPASAGSGVDLAARVFAEKLATEWRHPVVVDNRPGTDGIVGTQSFISSRDAHALLFAPAGSFTFGPHLHERLPYDPVNDVAPIASVGGVTLAIGVATGIEASSLAELASLIRQRPGTFVWTTVSPGGPELALKAFVAIESLQIKHATYRETSVAVQDIGAGRVHVVLGSIPSLAPLLQSGRIRLLAVTNSVRSDAAPNVATVGEAGFPMLTLDGVWGVFGSKNMPNELRRRVADDIARAAGDSDLVKRLAAVGLAVHATSSEQFAAALERQRKQAATLAKLSGVTVH